MDKAELIKRLECSSCRSGHVHPIGGAAIFKI